MKGERVSRKSPGYSLIELLAVIAILGLNALCAVPAFANYRRRMSVIAASEQLRNIFRATRARAIATGRNVGVKFIAGREWRYAIYADGDDDGVRNDDINRGVDRRLSGPAIVMPSFHIATIGLLPTTVKDPDGDPLQPDASPVQFGRSTICSFSPTGSGTPGTVYLVDGGGQLWAARVHGAGGRVLVLRYDAGRRKWERR
jgi:prepilin-type N-terminal cleavage/methylation domain-containing protein